MTSTSFVTLIHSAELHPRGLRPEHDPRFVPAGRPGVRGFGAAWLRANARGSLWLAQRMDPQPGGQSLAA